MTARLRRRRATSRFTGILGVATVLLLVAGSVIAFRANSGLPFEDTYRVSVDVPNGARLIKTSDVRIGGVRVGQVQRLRAVAPAGSRPFTRLELKLEPAAGPLPRDTRVSVRPGAVLGASYVAIIPGSSTTAVPDRGRLPAGAGATEVALPDLLDVFDRGTARAMQATFTELGDGVAGRGMDLNAAIDSLNDLLPPLSRVSAVLAGPPAQLPRFITALDHAFSTLMPVRLQLAGLIRGAAVTLEAVAQERLALGRTIDAAPAAELTTTTALRRLDPALAALARVSTRLEPVARRLPATLRAANRTLRSGTRASASLIPVGPPLRATFTQLTRLSAKPYTRGAIRKTASTFAAIGNLLAVLGPAQEHCNAVSLWAEGWAGVFGALGTGSGPGVANLVITSGGAQGEALQNRAPSPDIEINYLPFEGADECESGNNPGTGKQILGNYPGLQSRTTRVTPWSAESKRRAAAAGLLDDPIDGGR